MGKNLVWPVRDEEVRKRLRVVGYLPLGGFEFPANPIMSIHIETRRDALRKSSGCSIKDKCEEFAMFHVYHWCSSESEPLSCPYHNLNI